MDLQNSTKVSVHFHRQLIQFYNLFVSHDIHMIMTWAQEAKFIILKLKIKMNDKSIQIHIVCQPVGQYFQYVHMSNVFFICHNAIANSVVNMEARFNFYTIMLLTTLKCPGI